MDVEERMRRSRVKTNMLIDKWEERLPDETMPDDLGEAYSRLHVATGLVLRRDGDGYRWAAIR